MVEISCKCKECKLHLCGGACLADSIKLDECGTCMSFVAIHTCGECSKFGKPECSPNCKDLYKLIKADDPFCPEFEAAEAKANG